MASMSQLTMAMVTLYSGDPKRIQHFMKVYAFAKMIAEEEQLGAKQREIVEAAALVHDIGIHAAEKKYRSAAGEYQEIEGPPIARAMLMALDFSPALINRVCDMVAHHHSYDKIDEVDLQILIEADFMVNAYEDGLPKRNIKSFRDKIFPDRNGDPLPERIVCFGKLRNTKNTGYRIDRIQYPVFLCPQHFVQHHKLLFLGSQTNFISCL